MRRARPRWPATRGECTRRGCTRRRAPDAERSSGSRRSRRSRRGTRAARRARGARPSPGSRRNALPLELVRQIPHEPLRRDAVLLERVAVTNGDRAVLGGLAVDRDAERSAGLVLAPVAAADRAAVVVENG